MPDGRKAALPKMFAGPGGGGQDEIESAGGSRVLGRRLVDEFSVVTSSIQENACEGCRDNDKHPWNRACKAHWPHRGRECRLKRGCRSRVRVFQRKSQIADGLKAAVPPF